MTDQAWKRQFDAIGNSATAWRLSAGSLLAAASHLAHSQHAAMAETLSVGGPVSEAHWYHEPILLLRGCGLECLLKAHGLDVGKTLVVNGEYKGPRGHNLRKLAAWALFKTTEAERPLLDKLSLFVQRGRYPVSQSWEDGLVEGPDGAGKVGQLFGWTYPEDDTMLAGLVSRLVPAPNAGQAQPARLR
jgi:hypothetical protein